MFIYNEIRASNQPRETRMREARVLTPDNFDDIEDTDVTWDDVGGRPLYDYIQGWDKPHYPVPAIPCEITITHTYVEMYDRYKTVMFQRGGHADWDYMEYMT